MHQIRDYSDERNKGYCVHCNKGLFALDCNKDHVPTKGFLLEPYPDELPTIETHISCNSSFSFDEEYTVAFLSVVLAGSTDPKDQKNPSAARALGNEKLRARIEKSKAAYTAADDDARFMWNPETERINRVILKNARGHALYEYGEPMLTEPSQVWASPIKKLTVQERNAFEGISSEPTFAAWPEVGSRMMTRVMTGQDMDGPWVIVQDGIYRYSVSQEGGLTVRSVLWEYLATEVVWG